MRKTLYDPSQKFFVVYALNDPCIDSISTAPKIREIGHLTTTIYDTIAKAEDNKLSDGEMAVALQEALESIFTDSLVSLVNWWAI